MTDSLSAILMNLVDKLGENIHPLTCRLKRNSRLYRYHFLFLLFFPLSLKTTFISQFVRLAGGIGKFFPLTCQKMLLIRQIMKILSGYFSFYLSFFSLFLNDFMLSRFLRLFIFMNCIFVFKK